MQGLDLPAIRPFQVGSDTEGVRSRRPRKNRQTAIVCTSRPRLEVSLRVPSRCTSEGEAAHRCQSGSRRAPVSPRGEPVNVGTLEKAPGAPTRRGRRDWGGGAPFRAAPRSDEQRASPDRNRRFRLETASAFSLENPTRSRLIRTTKETGTRIDSPCNDKWKPQHAVPAPSTPPRCPATPIASSKPRHGRARTPAPARVKVPSWFTASAALRVAQLKGVVHVLACSIGSRLPARSAAQDPGRGSAPPDAAGPLDDRRSTETVDTRDPTATRPGRLMAFMAWACRPGGERPARCWSAWYARGFGRPEERAA